MKNDADNLIWIILSDLSDAVFRPKYKFDMSSGGCYLCGHVLIVVKYEVAIKNNFELNEKNIKQSTNLPRKQNI